MKFLKEAQKRFDELEGNTDWRQRDSLEINFSRLEKVSRAYVINCTGDCCVGDEVFFLKRIWEKQKINSYGKLANVVVGYELIEGEIIRDSYGKDKQQHTFTILLKDKEKLLIKGRNLYAMGTWRKPAKDEEARSKILDEKHERGRLARIDRAERRRNRDW